MDKQKLKFGWAEVNITPDKKIKLAGQFAERISQYVEKPLTATAMAVEAGDDQMVMVSADLVGIGHNLLMAVRENLKGNDLNLDPEKVIISAIHTHTGPVYIQQNQYKSRSTFRSLLESELPKDKKYVEAVTPAQDDQVATPQEVLDFLVDRLTEVILTAWKNCAVGAYSNAFGRAVVGMCRRATYSDGSAQMWGDTNTAVFEALEGGNDSGIELLYIFNEANKLTGIVANLACPAQCVQHRLFVSPDFWGEVKVLLRKRFGEDLFLLPLCSAAGDQCPVDLIRWVEPESDINDPNCKRNNPPKRKADPSMFDLAGMRKTGKRIANELIDVFEEGLDTPVSEAEFCHRVQLMSLPLRRTTLAEVAQARKAIREYLQNKEGDVDFNDAANLQVHLGILRRFEFQEQRDIWDTEVHIIRMGTVAFATNPFELFLDYGNQIKARSNAEQTFLVQLANGVSGYLPTKKAEEGGHYSAFISSGNVGHVGGEQLVRQTLTEIRDMFA
ncbi:MAG: hypothetical protein IJA47_03195 [Oscillospiraceae bacterium]|nr:hypothetical protein [Oscillospiraceae bacterium]